MNPDELKGLDMLVLLNPSKNEAISSSRHWRDAVREWVSGGGDLLVVSRNAHSHHEHDGSGLYLDGISLAVDERSNSELQISKGSCGGGRVVQVVGSEAFDTTGLGHCMAYPGEEQRARYDVAYYVFRDLLHVNSNDRDIYIP
jgi:hypothetical protein